MSGAARAAFLSPDRKIPDFRAGPPCAVSPIFGQAENGSHTYCGLLHHVTGKNPPLFTLPSPASIRERGMVGLDAKRQTDAGRGEAPASRQT